MTTFIVAILGVLHLAWGVGAIAAPRWFFDNFPGFGRHWTAAYPPYNEHLMTDVGAAFLALGVILLIAAAMRDRKVTNVVLIGLLVFSTAHLVFHSRHPGNLTGADLAASLTSLALGVVVPGLLLIVSAVRGSRRETPPPP
ncbi:MAG TPA: hypothetical protein VFC19_45395 [Candidatus Limnocylindrales bacterium]|nr:hypothetical protein [Candidatus Limnocylindrales bacterium]